MEWLQMGRGKFVENALKMEVGDGYTIMYISWYINYTFVGYTSKITGDGSVNRVLPLQNLNLIPNIHLCNWGSSWFSCFHLWSAEMTHIQPASPHQVHVALGMEPRASWTLQKHGPHPQPLPKHQYRKQLCEAHIHDNNTLGSLDITVSMATREKWRRLYKAPSKLKTKVMQVTES